MSVSHPRFIAEIKGSSEVIFGLIADMPHYGRWLSGSDAFGGTTDVTPYPVRLGTTYLDGGPLGQRPGSVTEFDPPHRITFHHTMIVKKGLLRADIDVHVHCTLKSVAQATLVTRDLDLTIQMPALLRWAQPLIVRAFRKENLRILAELKRYVERAPE